MGKIRLKLYSYDHKILDKAVREIIEAAHRVGTKTAGPIPLPTKIRRYTILRSTNIDKKSREQFEMRTHKRLVDIIDPSVDAVSTLIHLNLPAGVEVEIETIEE